MKPKIIRKKYGWTIDTVLDVAVYMAADGKELFIKKILIQWSGGVMYVASMMQGNY